MHKSSLFVVALAFPLTALAFDYTAHVPYSDVRPNSKEAAAINMFTNLSAVQGYGLGLFGPSRLVNRAEFMKMALATAPAELTEGLDMRYWEYTDCFPDVRKADWFNIYVCYGMLHDIVKGNPDTLFHPERTVNNAEALKIFTLIYGYDIQPDSSQPWMVPYYNSAAARGVDLPMRITFDTPLTRAQVMRLAAAFRAEHEGKLDEYRLAESGIYPAEESSSSSSASSESSVSSSASSVSSSMSSSSSSSMQASLYTLPSISHFLLAGAVSDAVADGTVRINGENGHIRLIEVKLYQEVLALDTLKVYTASGVEVMTLRQKVNDGTSDYKLTYRGQLEPGQDFAISGDTNIHLVVRANVRGLANNGASSQLLQMRTFNVTIQGDTTNTSLNQNIPAPFPIHQTSFGRITSVTPVGPATATLVSGSSAVVAAFSFRGTPIEGRALFVENLIFMVSKSDNVQTALWRLTSSDGTVSINCTTGSDGISCLNVPSVMGRIIEQGTVLQLRTDVQVSPGATGAHLQAELPLAGSPSEIGSVQWHDEAGHFRWVEKGVITGKGTRWQK